MSRIERILTHRQPSFFNRVAGDERPAYNEQRGAFGAAAVIGTGTARMERAAARWVDWVRYLAGDRLAVTVRVQSRDRTCARGKPRCMLGTSQPPNRT
jgi:hypothetical protein